MDIEFVKTLKSKISSNTLVSKDVANVCFAIIDYVAVGPRQKPHLTFAYLYRISPKVEEKSFYEAVFLLTRKSINVLTQEFEALHPRSGYQQVPNRKDIIQSMRSRDFYNPFTGKSLSEEEFGKEVITYFSPSQDFIKAVDDATSYLN